MPATISAGFCSTRFASLQTKVLQPLRPGVGRSRQRRRRLIGSIACQGLERPTGPETRRALARAFQEYGLPQVIRTDNGPPFAGVGLGSLSPLSAWWIKLGIVPERIEPGHPEQNGRLERLHRTLKAETASPPGANRRRQGRAFDHFRHSYNNERPHEALGQRPPVRLYTPSFRPYPALSLTPQEGGQSLCE